MAGITTVEDALKLGVTVEKKDIALYEELVKVVDNQDILQVFGNLKAASVNRHQPAFESVLAGGTGIGQGTGRGGRGVHTGSCIAG